MGKKGRGKKKEGRECCLRRRELLLTFYLCAFFPLRVLPILFNFFPFLLGSLLFLQLTIYIFLYLHLHILSFQANVSAMHPGTNTWARGIIARIYDASLYTVRAYPGRELQR